MTKVTVFWKSKPGDNRDASKAEYKVEDARVEAGFLHLHEDMAEGKRFTYQ